MYMYSQVYVNWYFIITFIIQAVKLHFLAYHERHLRWQEISPLYNKWYLLMLFVILLIFAATLLKVYSDYDIQV